MTTSVLFIPRYIMIRCICGIELSQILLFPSFHHLLFLHGWQARGLEHTATKVIMFRLGHK